MDKLGPQWVRRMPRLMCFVAQLASTTLVIDHGSGGPKPGKRNNGIVEVNGSIPLGSTR